MECPNCGAVLNDNIQKFCEKCGFELNLEVKENIELIKPRSKLKKISHRSCC